MLQYYIFGVGNNLFALDKLNTQEEDESYKLICKLLYDCGKFHKKRDKEAKQKNRRSLADVPSEFYIEKIKDLR